MYEIHEHLMALLAYCLRNVKEAPSPKRPPTPEVEAKVDAWFLRLAHGEKVKLPPKRLLGAMIPRLRFAVLYGSPAQSYFGALAAGELRPVDDAEILEWNLVRLWKDIGRDQWIAGKFS